MVAIPGSSPALLLSAASPVPGTLPALGSALVSLAPENHRGPLYVQSAASPKMASIWQPRPNALCAWYAVIPCVTWPFWIYPAGTPKRPARVGSDVAAGKGVLPAVGLLRSRGCATETVTV